MDQTKEQQTGFTHLIRDDGIHVYRLEDLKRETVDHFVDVSMQMDVDAYADGRHSRCLLDISTLSFPTPYAIKRIQESISATPDDLRESYAVVTPTTGIYAFARSVLSHIPNKKTDSIRLFASFDTAIDWLIDRLQELGP